MKIDEAISLLKKYIDYDCADIPDFYTMEEACEVVIKELEQRPTDAVDRVTIKEYLDSYNGVKTEQESCDDAVSRQKAIDAIDALYLDGDSCISFRANAEGDTLIGKYQAITAIDDLPSVTAQPKMGEWISNAEDDLKISEYTCSNCKGLSDEDSDFCPKCGAKMSEIPTGAEGSDKE